MDKLIADLLRNPVISTNAFALVMNPERPSRIHNQLRTKRPKFTEEETKNLLNSDELKWLSSEVKALNVESLTVGA